jgi:hypothetical protein
VKSPTDATRVVVSRPVLRLAWLALYAFLTLWAAFWSFFVVASAISDGRGAIPHAVKFLTALLTPFIVAFMQPRIGGLLLIGFGIGSAWYFADPGARLLLSAPAIMSGLLVLLLPRRRRFSAFPVIPLDSNRNP